MKSVSLSLSLTFLQEDVCSASPLPGFQELEAFCTTLVQLGDADQKLQLTTAQRNAILDAWNAVEEHNKQPQQYHQLYRTHWGNTLYCHPLLRLSSASGCWCPSCLPLPSLPPVRALLLLQLPGPGRHSTKESWLQPNPARLGQNSSLTAKCVDSLYRNTKNTRTKINTYCLVKNMSPSKGLQNSVPEL